MNALGKGSISSLLKKFITCVWYLEFLLLLTPPLVFLDDDGIRYSWPVTLSSAKTKPIIKTTDNKISDFQLLGRSDADKDGFKQTLSFEDSSLTRRLLQTLHNLVYIGLIMFVTRQLKKIFSGLSANQPFTNNNGTRIKWIAFSVLFLVFFDIIEDILHRLYTGSTIKLSGATFEGYPFNFDFRTFLLGLVLLILSEVFRKGYEYQTDSESIL